MCEQVRGFHRGVRKFIAKIQTTRRLAAIGDQFLVQKYSLRIKLYLNSTVTVHAVNQNQKIFLANSFIICL